MIVGLLVVRNEAERYLEACLHHVLPIVDVLSVFDDQSTDGSFEIAEDAGCAVTRRADAEPSFLQHEGRFRQAAWNAMEREVAPRLGDWVLTFDADEFLVSFESNPRNSLKYAALMAEAVGAFSVSVPIPEVFGWDSEQTPLVRKDGFWGDLNGIRYVAYHLGGRLSDKKMGSGCEPSYVYAEPVSKDNCGLNLLHFGYAEKKDRRQKYTRYVNTSLGHNPVHIESILEDPSLEPWDGPIPEVYRGR